MKITLTHTHTFFLSWTVFGFVVTDALSIFAHQVRSHLLMVFLKNTLYFYVFLYFVDMIISYYQTKGASHLKE